MEHSTLNHEDSEPSAGAPAPAEQNRQELKREVTDFVKLVMWFLVVFLVLRTYVIEGYEVQGPSMSPNLQNNERILVFKLPHILSQFEFFSGVKAIGPGDIVVFNSPDNPRKRYVKRVIALGPPSGSGKTVSAGTEGVAEPEGAVTVHFDKGVVYVNNRKLAEDYLQADARVSSDTQKLVLGPGEFYVLGDNRTVSKDSRSFRAIHDDMIIGKAVLRFWPPKKFSFLR